MKSLTTTKGLPADQRPRGLVGNQWTADKRQKLFIRYYFQPESDTFLSVKDSALKAGYSKDYAKVLKARMDNRELDWLSKYVNIDKETIVFNLMLLLKEANNTSKDSAETKRRIWDTIGVFSGHKVLKQQSEVKKIVISLNSEDIK